MADIIINWVESFGFGKAGCRLSRQQQKKPYQIQFDISIFS